MEWHLLTPLVKEIDDEQGECLSPIHPLIPHVCVSEHPFTPITKEREREGEQGDAIHPWYMKVNGMAFTHCLYKGDRGSAREVVSTIHPLSHFLCI